MKKNISIPDSILAGDFATITWYQQLIDLIRSDNIGTLSNYANNAAAIAGGLVVGDMYRNGDTLCIVH